MKEIPKIIVPERVDDTNSRELETLLDLQDQKTETNTGKAKSPSVPQKGDTIDPDPTDY